MIRVITAQLAAVPLLATHALPVLILIVKIFLILCNVLNAQEVTSVKLVHSPAPTWPCVMKISIVHLALLILTTLCVLLVHTHHSLVLILWMTVYHAHQAATVQMTPVLKLVQKVTIVLRVLFRQLSILAHQVTTVMKLVLLT